MGFGYTSYEDTLKRGAASARNSDKGRGFKKTSSRDVPFARPEYAPIPGDVKAPVMDPYGYGVPTGKTFTRTPTQKEVMANSRKLYGKNAPGIDPEIDKTAFGLPVDNRMAESYLRSGDAFSRNGAIERKKDLTDYGFNPMRGTGPSYREAKQMQWNTEHANEADAKGGKSRRTLKKMKAKKGRFSRMAAHHAKKGRK